MPYADPERRRAAQREAQRRRRAGGGDRQPTRQPLPALVELKYATARGVVELLHGQAEAVLSDQRLGTLERARCLGYLAAVLLRAVEVADVAARVEALERRLDHPDPTEDLPC